MRIVIVLLALSLGACVNTRDDINFERMNEAELAAYNQTRPVAQMIVCMEEERNFSRVRRRSCMTVEQAYGSERQADQLGVLSAVPGFSGTE